MDGFHLTEDVATNMIGLVFFASAVVSPLLGFLLDTIGKTITCLLFALSASGLCHLVLTFAFRGNISLEIIWYYLVMVMMGMAYSLVTIAIWPIASIAFKIPDKMLCTAYGLMQASLNLGTAVISEAVHTFKTEYENGTMEVSRVG